MLRLARPSPLQGPQRYFLRAIFHAIVSKTGLANPFGSGNQALSAGHRLHAEGILNGFGLHEHDKLAILLHIDALTLQGEGDRRGKHKHVFVKTKFYIGHGEAPLQMGGNGRDGSAPLTDARCKLIGRAHGTHLFGKRTTSPPGGARHACNGKRSKGLFRDAIVAYGPAAPDSKDRMITSEYSSSLHI